jgi:uncharacterized protein YqgQ
MYYERNISYQMKKYGMIIFIKQKNLWIKMIKDQEVAVKMKMKKN